MLEKRRKERRRERNKNDQSTSICRRRIGHSSRPATRIMVELVDALVLPPLLFARLVVPVPQVCRVWTPEGSSDSQG